MLRPRIIPNLLIKNGGLVKTINFKDPVYIGDPINTVRIFNEKEVDELSVFDIDASVKGIEPNYQLIGKIATQARMPICYGGGVKTVEQAYRISQLGIEKIGVSSGAFEKPELLQQIASKIGFQSVVLVLDLKKNKSGDYNILIHNSLKTIKENPFDMIAKASQMGVGEIVINSIDQDGLMNGFDYNMIEKARAVTSLPLTVLGGAGSLDDIKNVINKYKIIGVAVGSLFIFKGAYKAVLVNYPNKSEKENLYK